MAQRVDLVEIGAGNVGSVLRCLQRLNVAVRRSTDRGFLDGNAPIVVPGVGCFGAVMEHLRQSGLCDNLCQLVEDGTPYLGICIGMQILFERSAESADVPGLSLIPGEVIRFRNGKVPQIGWNKVSSAQSDWQSGFAYFVNSYHCVPANGSITLYEANYYERFCAGLQKNNITAFQFHPEKSSDFGRTIMQRWLLNV